MDVREKLIEICFREFCDLAGDSPCGCDGCPYKKYSSENGECYEEYKNDKFVKMEKTGVTVQEWINSEEMLPEFPCLALYVNGDYVFIPDGILTIKDKHGEWCIDAALAKEVRLIDGTKAETLLWENRIAYWMPLPNLPEDGGANHA